MSVQYKLAGCLVGHQDAILCLAISNAGKMLASGGFDGLRLWDVQRMRQLAKPTQMRNPGDPITCAMWLTRKGDLQEVLCAGTGLGYLILWRQRADTTTEFDEIFSRRIGTGHEVMSISQYNIDGGTRIITGTCDKRAQLWTLDSKLNLTNIFSIELATTIPRALFSQGTDILVFGMYDGEIHTLRGKDSLVLATKSTGLMIGGAAFDETSGYFVVDNAVNGFSLHRLEDGACVRSYNTKPLKTYPKQVTFAEKGKKIVGGGESGEVHVFDKDTGKLAQTLKHSRVGRVQTITTHDNEDSSLIIAASSSSEDGIHISLWKKDYFSSAPDSKKSNTQSSFYTVIQAMTHLVTIIVAILLVQTLNPHIGGKEVKRITALDYWHDMWYQSSRQAEINDVHLLLQQLVEQQMPDSSGLATRRREDWTGNHGELTHDDDKIKQLAKSGKEGDDANDKLGDRKDGIHGAFEHNEHDVIVDGSCNIAEGVGLQSSLGRLVHV